MTFKRTKIIAGFPGVGKSHFCRNAKGLVILDSDSSMFSRAKDGARNPDFPRNYIEHIKNHIGKADVILVSTHQEVRDALRENGIHYYLIYPDRRQKESYIDRYRERGSSDEFITMLEQNWDSFLDDIERETFPTKVKLNENEYLSDVIMALIDRAPDETSAGPFS